MHCLRQKISWKLQRKPKCINCGENHIATHKGPIFVLNKNINKIVAERGISSYEARIFLKEGRKDYQDPWKEPTAWSLLHTATQSHRRPADTYSSITRTRDNYYSTNIKEFTHHRKNKPLNSNNNHGHKSPDYYKQFDTRAHDHK